MKPFHAAILALSLAMAMAGLAVTESAQAARLGGGRSIGALRSMPPRQALPPAQQSPQAAAGQGIQNAGTRADWQGPLAGTALGLGLGWLLAQGGMGPMLLGLLVVAAAIALIMRMDRSTARHPAPALAGPLHYAGLGNETVAAPPPSQQPAEGSWVGGNEPASPLVPRDFDTDGFLAQARTHFLHLQSASDAGNLALLRDLTTDGLHAQLAADIQRRSGPQHTEVVLLEAALLEVSTEAEAHWASVRFTGQVSETAGAPPVPFAEVWHLQKPVRGASGWLVAGIGQIG